jgi:hypothetical protein
VSLIVAALLLLGASAQARRVAEVPLPSHAAVYQLPRDLTILSVTDRSARVLVTDADLARIRALGYSPAVTIPDYQAWIDSVQFGYRTYTQVCSTMVSLAQTFPQVCRLDTLGRSVHDSLILAMRVTDNPQIEEAEPEFRILGPHHGDEKIATEITLSFLQYVLASYDTSTAIHNLVDSTELWVIPIVNVDGFVLNQRENANGIDLNRDYGYRWSGMGGSPSPFSQPETRLIRQHSIDNNICMEFAYHSAAAYVNYLWDNHPADPPDSGLVMALAQQYADSTYGSNTTQLDTINGYGWYEVDGSCQDAGFGLHGNLAYTIETERPAPQAKIDSICVANRRALLGMIRACRQGVSGTVRDSLSGTPLFARISVDSPLRWDCYTDQTLGDYHHLLQPGTYALTAHAQGFLPKTVAGIVVPGFATADFDLAPDTAGQVYVEEMVWLNHGDPNLVMPTTSIKALGAPDDSSFSLGRRGDVCLSAGRGRAVTNLPGDDITVFDSDSIADGYWLYAGNHWAGPWTSLGHGNGTNSFDIGSSGLDSARYLRIVCDSTGSASDPKAGLDLDAVAYAVLRTPVVRPLTPDPRPLFAVYPNPASRVLLVTLPPACRRMEIIDIAGRAVKCYPFGRGLSPTGDCPQGRYAIDVLSAGLGPGVYLARFETTTGTSQLKFVVARP